MSVAWSGVLASSVWLPPEGSAWAEGHDLEFRLLLIFGGALLALFVLALDLVLLQNLRRGVDDRGGETKEGRWARTLVPAGVFVGVAALWTSGMGARIDAAVAPAESFTVQASVAADGWTFTYPNTATADTLRLPAGRPARLRFSSADAGWTVRVPALRFAGELRPGEAVETWAEPRAAGLYGIATSRLDGFRADSLATALEIQEPGDFDAWLARMSDPVQMYPPVQAGRVLVERNGCLVCHSVDGSRITGPSFLGLLARTRDFEDGGSAAADSLYVRESILEPQARVVAGFQPVMPSFSGRISDPQISAILAWLRSLDEEAGS